NGYIDDINGWDMADNDNKPNPPSATFFHGTHCAGDAAAVADNGVGISSIGFNVSIMAVKAAPSSGSPDQITMGLEGMVYAADAGARVISHSWGLFTTASSDLKQIDDAVSYAYGKGCIILGAAGNNSSSTPFYPAASNHVISVAATNQDDTKRSASNYGSTVDISAPGDLYSTMPNGAYMAEQGTSMACPLTAGLCALMLSLNPALTPAQVESCLKSSAVNIDAINPSYKNGMGAGRIDAEAAMKCVAATLTTSVDNVSTLLENNIFVYPNPSNGSIQITFHDLSKNDFKIEITNALSQIVYTEQLLDFKGEYTKQLDLSPYGKGIYILALHLGNQNIVRKVIVY
ncbi:MAG: S8 family peptidase, partial [Bacteroidetes bacterium]|nr:S8 family peptidase [Bacteroidota bacterium]